MDNQHPIPQDITGFQFKLIGQMTVKQFIYLAIGAVLAWIFFFILSLPALIKWPLSLISFIGGVAFAFVPIDGRPMDVMLGNFISAIFAPTKFIYKKTGTPDPDKPVLDQTHPPTLKPITVPFSQGQNKIPEAKSIEGKPADAKAKADQEKIIEGEKKLKEKEEDLQKKLNEAQALENTETSLKDMSEAHKKTQELERLLNEVNSQKQELEKQLIVLQEKLLSQKQMYTPSTAQPLRETRNVRKIPQAMKKSAGVANIPDAPNLITGIIKDPRANPLPNILVEVKDTDDNPVRAFKTNGLGQFASATSLSNGKYQIVFEDPKAEHRFDSVEIEATGEVIMPLEVTSIDAREELRRELFN